MMNPQHLNKHRLFILVDFTIPMRHGYQSNRFASIQETVYYFYTQFCILIIFIQGIISGNVSRPDQSSILMTPFKPFDLTTVCVILYTKDRVTSRRLSVFIQPATPSLSAIGNPPCASFNSNLGGFTCNNVIAPPFQKTSDGIGPLSFSSSVYPVLITHIR